MLDITELKKIAEQANEQRLERREVVLKEIVDYIEGKVVSYAKEGYLKAKTILSLEVDTFNIYVDGWELLTSIKGLGYNPESLTESLLQEFSYINPKIVFSPIRGKFYISWDIN